MVDHFPGRIDVVSEAEPDAVVLWCWEENMITFFVFVDGVFIAAIFIYCYCEISTTGTGNWS
jgi:hypothetical protein